MKRTCECGCGVTTSIYKKSDARIGAIQGQHARYVKGHNGRKHSLDGTSGIQWSPEDTDSLQMHTWRVGAGDGIKSYAFTQIDGKTVYMHRYLLNAPKNVEVDHINGDTLDNHRENLRLATKQENGRNRKKQAYGTSSRFKGVSWDKRSKSWIAQISSGNGSRYIGLFVTEEEAAVAYNEKARLIFGEFARLNDL